MTDELYSPEEAMPLEDRERYYNEKVRQVVQFAYDNAPAVKDRLDKAGIKPSQIRTTRDLDLIPFITRDDIIELQKANPPFGGLLAVPVQSLYKVIYSPGPMYIPLASQESCTGGARKVLHSIGLRKGDMAILSMPTLFTAGAGSEAAMELNGIVAVIAGAGNTELQVNMILDLGIQGDICNTNFLLNLLQTGKDVGVGVTRWCNVRCGR